MPNAEPSPRDSTPAASPADALETLRRWERSVQSAWGRSVGLRLAGFALLGLLILAYLRWFMFTPLPGLPENIRTGRPTERVVWMERAIVLDDLVKEWFGKPAEFAVVDRLLPLGVALAIWAVAGAVGWLGLRALRLTKELTLLEQAVFALGAGMNLVSLYTLLVGLAGLLAERWIYVAPGAIALLAAGFLAWRERAAGGFPGERLPTPKLADDGDAVLARWLPWAAVPFAAVVVLGGLLPPIDFDVREYHLQVPKEWFQAGRVSFLPHNVYGNMPLGAEMPTAAAMAVLGDWWLGALAGKTVIALWALVGAAAVYAAGVRFFDRRVASVAMVVYLSTPWIMFPSMNGLVEGALAAYFMLAGFAAALWRVRAVADGQLHGRLLALGGFLAGSAVACKYPAVLFGVLPLLLVVFSVRKGADLRPPAILLAAVAMACGPWLVKNWVLTGNPVYPLLYDVFGGATRDQGLNEQWVRAHRNFDRSAPALLLSLWRVVGASEWLSPLLVPLALLAGLSARWRLAALALGAYVAFFFVEWWFMTHRIDRFLVPALPALALMAGIGAVWTRAVPWQWMLRGLLFVGLGANFITVTCPLGADNRYFVSYATLRYDPERTDSWHQWLKENVPAGKQALLVGDAQPFDLELPAIYSTTFDVSPLETWLKAAETPDEVWQSLTDAGISHIYVRWDEIKRYQSPGNYGFSNLISPSVFKGLIDYGVLDNPIFIPKDATRMVYPVPPVKPKVDDSGAPADGVNVPAASQTSPTTAAPVVAPATSAPAAGKADGSPALNP